MLLRPYRTDKGIAHKWAPTAVAGTSRSYSRFPSGTGIEVCPERTELFPGQRDDEQGHAILGESPAAVAFHALLSVAVDRQTIEAIGAREGWRTRHFWRGPPNRPLFELYEFWVENRVMLELATIDMLPGYTRITNAVAQQQLLASRAR